MPIRKKNSTRKREPLFEAGIKYVRKKIESVFSVIVQKLPRHIHAVTPRGFELKIILFVLAYSIQKAML
jgi:hypothetical protein